MFIVAIHLSCIGRKVMHKKSRKYSYHRPRQDYEKQSFRFTKCCKNFSNFLHRIEVTNSDFNQRTEQQMYKFCKIVLPFFDSLSVN